MIMKKVLCDRCGCEVSFRHSMLESGYVLTVSPNLEAQIKKPGSEHNKDLCLDCGKAFVHFFQSAAK